MSSWRTLLGKLVQARGTDCFPLCALDVTPPSGRSWPECLPSCQGLRNCYALCDGGQLSLQYKWRSLAEIESETKRWREILHDDVQPALIPGRHVVLAIDSGGAPVIWDAEADQLASFYWKGGGWEPYNLDFEAFMEALFNHPERVAAEDMWGEALVQLTELDRDGVDWIRGEICA